MDVSTSKQTGLRLLRAFGRRLNRGSMPFKLKALMGNKDHDRYRDAFGKSNHKIMIASHVNTKTAIMIIIS